MKAITDFTKLSKDAFWKKVDAEGPKAKERFRKLWKEMEERTPSQEEAAAALDDLFLYSHLRMKEYNAKLAKNYPTTQFTKNRLSTFKNLWWVDHFTAGISEWSTLNWFSAGQVTKKNGKKGLAGASTHFVMGYHGEPFYIIPLMHGAWHEPRRNSDSFSIEHVNCGGVSKQDDGYHYWAGKIPDALVRELPPTALGTPYKGLKLMQPFTTEQIINNIKLKRLVIAAFPEALELSRMSEHADWREGKTDMGPLWPKTDCNQSAFLTLPLAELAFVQAEYAAEIHALPKLPEMPEEEKPAENPSYGFDTPTADDDAKDEKHYTVEEIQTRLQSKGFAIAVDGQYGAKTAAAVKRFQNDWTKQNRKDPLTEDGIAGPQTLARLFKETNNAG